MFTRKLSALEVFEAENWRKELWAFRESTVNKNGLSSIVEKAMEDYVTVAEHCYGGGLTLQKFFENVSEGRRQRTKYVFPHLPWNLAWGEYSSWAGMPRWRNFRQSDQLPEWHASSKQFANYGKLLECAARFAGWLKTLAWFYGAVRVIEATQGSGVGSPYTTVNLYKLFDRWPSPHRLERTIWKARARANQVLRPYGLRVSWSALGQALAQHSAVGKIALWAAEETVKVYLSYYDSRFQYYQKRELGQGRFFYLKLARGLAGMKDHSEVVQRWAVSKCFDGEFETLREALAVSARLRLDATDGVELYLDTMEVIHGVEVVAGYAPKRSGFGDNSRTYLLRQVHADRTYHAHGSLSPKSAVREALTAWKRQRDLEKEEVDLASFLKGDRGYSPLVFRESSYQAGNCQPGTEAWLERMGWAGMKFIPGQWLLPHLGDSQVRRVAVALLKSF